MQILMHEVGLCDTVDPLAGSYFVETMTNRMEAHVTGLMERLEAEGGIVRGIAEGRVQAEVNRQAYEREQKLRAGEIRKVGRNPVEGLVGIRNMAISVLPLFSMCDRRDIGGIVESSNTGSPTMFLYDRFDGGLGFAETGYHRIEDLLRGCLELVRECDCEDGCPSCVGLPILRPPIQQDPDAGGSWPIPDKESARLLLEALLSAE